MMRVVLLAQLFLVGIFAESGYTEISVELKSNVNKDLQDFVNLLPSAGITSFRNEYIANDQEVKNNWDYLHSTAVKDKIERINGSVEFEKVMNHLTSAKVERSKLISMYKQIISTPPGPSSPLQGPGLRGLLMGSIRPLIPTGKIKYMAMKKYIFSSQFRRLMKVLKSKAFETDVLALVNSEEVKILENDAVQNGVDMKAIYDFIDSFSFLYLYLKYL